MLSYGLTSPQVRDGNLHELWRALSPSYGGNLNTYLTRSVTVSVTVSVTLSLSVILSTRLSPRLILRLSLWLSPSLNVSISGMLPCYAELRTDLSTS